MASSSQLNSLQVNNLSTNNLIVNNEIENSIKDDKISKIKNILQRGKYIGTTETFDGNINESSLFIIHNNSKYKFIIYYTINNTYSSYSSIGYSDNDILSKTVKTNENNNVTDIKSTFNEINKNIIKITYSGYKYSTIKMHNYCKAIIEKNEEIGFTVKTYDENNLIIDETKYIKQ